MDVVFRGRHCPVTDRFRQHVEDKLTRLERWTRSVDRIEVEVSREGNPRLADRSERVELTVHSRSPIVRAEAAAEDRYAALDRALDKLQARLRKIADRRRVHHGSRRPKSVGEAMGPVVPVASGVPMAAAYNGSAPGGPALATHAVPAARSAPELTSGVDAASDAASAGMAGTAGMAVMGDGPLVVREKTHRADPMTLDDALYQMELVGHDFYLFVDAGSGLPSVVYRRCGYDYGVIRLATRT